MPIIEGEITLRWDWDEQTMIDEEIEANDDYPEEEFAEATLNTDTGQLSLYPEDMNCMDTHMIFEHFFTDKNGKQYKICEVCFNYVLNPTVREYCKRPIRINICPNCHTEFGWDNHEYLDE
jgi:hypothetical protein